MTAYQLKDGCPKCSRSPAVRFSEAQVNRSKHDRAAGLHSEIQCPRCSHRWWVRNRDVAAAVEVKEPTPRKKKRKAAG